MIEELIQQVEDVVTDRLAQHEAKVRAIIAEAIPLTDERQADFAFRVASAGGQFGAKTHAGAIAIVNKALGLSADE